MTNLRSLGSSEQPCASERRSEASQRVATAIVLVLAVPAGLGSTRSAARAVANVAEQAVLVSEAAPAQALEVRLYLPAAARSEHLPPPQPTPTPWVAEENDPIIRREGPWQEVSDPAAAGGSYLVSEQPGSSLSFSFRGTNLAIYRTILPDGGRARLTIDGQAYGEVAFAAPQINEPRYQVPAVIDRLSAGGHTATLTVLESSGATRKVTFDRLAVPSGLEPSENQRLMVERANHYRRLTGLPLLEPHRALHLAAQSHAEYCATHGLTHNQSPDRPGFIGASLTDRARYYGYGWASSEVAAMGPPPAAAVDTWIHSVYHRLPFMDYRSAEFGVGFAGQRWGYSVIDFGSRGWAAPAERRVVAFPVHNQTEVPTSFSGNEWPNPLPGKTYPTGYPISLHIIQPAAGRAHVAGEAGWDGTAQQGWQLSEATLRDAGGQPVATYVLDPASDPNKLLRDAVFVLAERPLSPRTRYTVKLAGTDSRGLAFDVEWSFVTGSALENCSAILAPISSKLDRFSSWPAGHACRR